MYQIVIFGYLVFKLSYLSDILVSKFENLKESRKKIKYSNFFCPVSFGKTSQPQFKHKVRSKLGWKLFYKSKDEKFQKEFPHIYKRYSLEILLTDFIPLKLQEMLFKMMNGVH